MLLRTRVLLLFLILLASVMRFDALFSNHFHADEALFAAWARLIAVWRDPLLQAQAVDKPPLLFYLQALAFPLMGPEEWAARLPNLIASLLTVPLAAVFAWRLLRNGAAALIAALTVALSPLAIQFSATAFTDPLLTAFLCAGLLLTVGRSRPFWAGFCFGMAVLTKHQAWLFAPLFAGLAWSHDWHRREWWRALAGFLPLLFLFVGWQLMRDGHAGLWSRQLANYGGLRIAWSWELWPRAQGWFALSPFVPGSNLMLLLLLLSMPLAWQPRQHSVRPATLALRLIILFLFAYAALHWLLAVPIWDRYLLPLVPLAAVVLGCGLSLLTVRLLRARKVVAPGQLAAYTAVILLLTALQMPTALHARDGGFPIGGSREADQGAWQIAQYLEDAPYGTVLYDHWYSWHWQYAFIDKGVYTSWFAHPVALAEDLQVFGREKGQRYLVLPADDRRRPILRAVNRAGFLPVPLLQSDAQPGMILYRLDRLSS